MNTSPKKIQSICKRDIPWINQEQFQWIPKPAKFSHDMFEVFFESETTIKTKGLRHEQSTDEKKLETTLGNIQNTKSNLEDDT